MDSLAIEKLLARKQCLVCRTENQRLIRENKEQGLYTIPCTNCGTYIVSDTVVSDWANTWSNQHPDYYSSLSHKIRRRQRPGDPPFVDSTWLNEHFREPPVFPNAFEQVENLIIFLAETLKPGEVMRLDKTTCQAVVGASDEHTLGWVLKSAIDNGWIQGHTVHEPPAGIVVPKGTLTLDGWEWYKEIGRHKQSRTAFMAMKYGDSKLTSVVDKYFRPAVSDCGFTLKLLNDTPEAGLIDNRLRVEIRRSRFLIADLTHANNGAYWEAGFGEGLGLPVIYTCEKSVLSNKEIHFDTRNCQIVPWDENSPDDAALELKATIRNTLPDEAVLEDPIK